jgi:hypothetical protein
MIVAPPRIRHNANIDNSIVIDGSSVIITNTNIRKSIYMLLVESILSGQFSKLQRELLEIIDPDEVLLERLVSKNILTAKKRMKISKLRDTQTKNEELLKHLQDDFTGDYWIVLHAFAEAGQEHVVNYILAEGGNLNGFIYASDNNVSNAICVHIL